MKSAILSIIFLFSFQSIAGIGGSGGGAIDAIDISKLDKFYSAEVCETTESGIVRSCRMIKFKRKLGEASRFQQPEFCDGDRQNTICDQPNAHVPELLGKINRWFLNRGFTPPQPQPEHNN